jgi:hypothetical protein
MACVTCNAAAGGVEQGLTTLEEVLRVCNEKILCERELARQA